MLNLKSSELSAIRAPIDALFVSSEHGHKMYERTDLTLLYLALRRTVLLDLNFVR